MRKLSRKFGIVFGIILCLLTSACAFTQGMNTKDKKYLFARDEYNMLLEEYLSVQYTVSDEVSKKMSMTFYTADIALDSWSKHLDSGEPYQADIQKWIESKNIIVNVLQEVLE